jgi:formamidase
VTSQGVGAPATDEMFVVDEYTNGILDPVQPMLGPVADGAYLRVHTSPGCWGPMLTPEIRGGHEVTRPVAVEGAEIGDAVVIRVLSVAVDSLATASGDDELIDGRFVGDPYIAVRCPGCGAMYPETVVEGIGDDAIRCADCGAATAPFRFAHGYTIVFDSQRATGVTVNEHAAQLIGRDATRYAALPAKSCQNSVLTMAPHDLVGVATRLRPMVGQLGTVPAIAMPDSHNCGDFGSFLIGAPHEYGISAEDLNLRTDGHLDIDEVRAGATLICPVKVDGGGVYVGDVHALQGDGEIAGHTCDVAATVELQVGLIKGLTLDGPILLPVEDDLPFLARPLSQAERESALRSAQEWGMNTIEESAPLSVIGTGADLDAAIRNGLERAATLLSMSVSEVKNRATITGAIELGRHPGVVHVTFLAPVERLEPLGLLPLVRSQYRPA